jgi:hypothetical protein
MATVPAMAAVMIAAAVVADEGVSWANMRF